MSSLAWGACGGAGKQSPLLGYVPYHELDGRPNVVVDGAPAEGTVLCLSHWPGITSPARFLADLSAQMAFAYLSTYDAHEPATAVSNNHYDQDGLVSLYALSQPEAALARRDLLIDVARAGDFARFRYREAARVSMVLSAYATPGRSPLNGLADDYATTTAQIYTETLGRLGELCDHPDRYRHLWEEEDASLDASEAALATGAVTIEEIVDIDLAVMTVAESAPQTGGHRFPGEWVSGLHPMAIWNATDRFAVLLIRGHSYEFSYGYESWVQYQSRRPRPRVDLIPLAERLNAEEHGPGRWVAGPVSDLLPTLALQGAEHSNIDPRRFQAIVEDNIRNAQPAWNPYSNSAR
jgi:hypothetical protein